MLPGRAGAKGGAARARLVKIGQVWEIHQYVIFCNSLKVVIRLLRRDTSNKLLRSSRPAQRVKKNKGTAKMELGANVKMYRREQRFSTVRSFASASV